MNRDKNRVNIILTKIVFVSLIISLIYGIVGIIILAILKTTNIVYHRPKGDYIKITLQCILGISVLYLPEILEKRLKISVTNVMHILFVSFLYAAIFLGEVQGFYKKFFHWDTLLHTLSGVMLSTFGFSLIDIANNSKRINIDLKPWFIALFSFCFAVTLDTIWEIFEFTMDRCMDLNMQQYIAPDGTVLVGSDALVDTMKDLIVDILGALSISIIGYFSIRNKK
ncbi:MAG: hypothetical protein LBQ77_03120 [Treponema sp.]|jgi:hypothetical protein|nr:hypothetical protein [Treponema sp.]